MKKIVFLLMFVLTSIGVTLAQDDCLPFFPSEEGATMVTESYDSNKNLLFTVKYHVKETYNSLARDNSYIAFKITDKSGKEVDHGYLEAYCDNDGFYMKSVNWANNLDVMKDLSLSNVQLLGGYLDYPDFFRGTLLGDDLFKIDEAEFTIKDKANSKDYMRVRIHDRKYLKNEKIETPAGTFDAAKTTFRIEVYDHQTKKSHTYKNTEWYALGAGIVKSEIYDTTGKLMNYTELVSLNKK